MVQVSFPYIKRCQDMCPAFKECPDGEEKLCKVLADKLDGSPQWHEGDDEEEKLYTTINKSKREVTAIVALFKMEYPWKVKIE